MIKTDKNKTDGKRMVQAETKRIQLQTGEGRIKRRQTVESWMIQNGK